jgi:uncharacterized SAM-binding protein YcdF (DUF218 family)
MRKIAPYDAILVLGFKVWPNGELSATDRRRLNRAIAFYRRGLAPIMIMVGIEAEAMREYAVAQNIPRGHILVERKSVNTIANICYVCTDHLQPRGYRRVLVVTSNFHRRRTKLIVGWVFDDQYTMTVRTARSGLSIRAYLLSIIRETSLRRFNRRILEANTTQGDASNIAHWVTLAQPEWTPWYRRR